MYAIFDQVDLFDEKQYSLDLLETGQNKHGLN